MRFYVYDLVDPRTDETFYVGKGQRNRIDHHEREAANGVKSRKCNRIREIWQSGDRVQKVIVRRFEREDEAYAYEAERVESFGLKFLTNVIPGGLGSYVSVLPVSSDAAAVRAFVKVYQHTRGGAVRGLWVSGQYLDLAAILNSYRQRANEAVRRRGREWACRLFATEPMVAE